LLLGMPMPLLPNEVPNHITSSPTEPFKDTTDPGIAKQSAQHQPWQGWLLLLLRLQLWQANIHRPAAVH
jgi:hypothetical protein